MGRLPCSEEVFPLGFHDGEPGSPRAVCSYLLESFERAGVSRAFVLLCQGKWDIPAYLGRGSEGLPLAYLAFEPTPSVPATLDQAYPFVAEATVALGFPDILIEPADAYGPLLDRLRDTETEVVLGLFPTDQSWKADMVEIDDLDRVRRIVIKQTDTGLSYTWSIAVWGPAFSRFLHEFVRRQPAGEGAELYVGDVIRAAIDEGMQVLGVRFPRGSFLDVGTPEDLRRAVARFAPRGDG